MKNVSSTQKALLGIVVLTLVVVAFKASSGQSSSGRGGTLFATQVSANNVSLESDRFYCASCVTRMESDFDGIEGILSIDIIQGDAGLGALNITFDQDKLDIDSLADIGKRSLESDPYNKDTVTIVLK